VREHRREAEERLELPVLRLAPDLLAQLIGHPVKVFGEREGRALAAQLDALIESPARHARRGLGHRRDHARLTPRHHEDVPPGRAHRH
jgi:hypothetical protein